MKDELETAVLNLPVEERARLARKLIASIDVTPDAALDGVWIRAADQRAEQVLTGEVELVAGDEVFRKAYAHRRQK